MRKTLRSFKNKSVDLGRYVKDFYLQDGFAYISCNVKNYHDIIDRYSVKEYECLNPRFSAFVDANAYYIPTEYPIILEITGTHFSAKQRAVITETISDHYSLVLGDRQMDLDQNRRKCLIMTYFGLFFAVVVYGMSLLRLLDVLKETILILFWFFVWELGDILLFERPGLKAARVDASQLSSMKVIFNDTFEDVPIDSAVAEEFLEEILE